ATDTNGVGRVGDAQGAVPEQRPAEAPALLRMVDRQATKHRDRDRVGHVAAEAAYTALHGDRAGGEGVVADYTMIVGDDEGAGCAADLVWPRALLQPLVERSDAGDKIVELMRVIERLRLGQRHRYSQGGTVCTVRRSRSFGFGGSSRRARKAAWASGLTAKTVRSSSASSAARRAASSTKSVRVFPVSVAARSIRPRSSALMRRLRVSRRGAVCDLSI